MNILVITEIDWLKKPTYEMHHLSELFSLKGHNVYAIDIQDPGLISYEIFSKPVKNYHRIYDNASVTLFRTPVIPVKGLSRISGYFSYDFIKNKIKENKIDVVFLYSVVTNSQATIKACKELKIPIIHRTFDMAHELIRENYLRNSVLKIEKIVYPKFDLVIANTPHMKKWAEEMGAKKVIVISQGVDPNIMKPVEKNIELQRELKLKDSDKVAMYLGTLLPFDGLDNLFKQIPKIIQKIPSFKLLVVGGGKHLKKLESKVKKLKIQDMVIFTGYQPYRKVLEFCSVADLCVNTFEITEMTKKLSPQKIFDILSCGKPLIATPLDGLLFDFPKESKTIKYANLEEFGEKIIDFFSKSNTPEMYLHNRQFIIENYTWGKISEKMLNEISSIKN